MYKRCLVDLPEICDPLIFLSRDPVISSWAWDQSNRPDPLSVIQLDELLSDRSEGERNPFTIKCLSQFAFPNPSLCRRAFDDRLRPECLIPIMARFLVFGVELKDNVPNAASDDGMRRLPPEDESFIRAEGYGVIDRLPFSVGFYAEWV